MYTLENMRYFIWKYEVHAKETDVKQYTDMVAWEPLPGMGETVFRSYVAEMKCPKTPSRSSGSDKNILEVPRPGPHLSQGNTPYQCLAVRSSLELMPTPYN